MSRLLWHSQILWPTRTSLQYVLAQHYFLKIQILAGGSSKMIPSSMTHQILCLVGRSQTHSYPRKTWRMPVWAPVMSYFNEIQILTPPSNRERVKLRRWSAMISMNSKNTRSVHLSNFLSWREETSLYSTLRTGAAGVGGIRGSLDLNFWTCNSKLNSRELKLTIMPSVCQKYLHNFNNKFNQQFKLQNKSKIANLQIDLSG